MREFTEGSRPELVDKLSRLGQIVAGR